MFVEIFAWLFLTPVPGYIFSLVACTQMLVSSVSVLYHWETREQNDSF